MNQVREINVPEIDITSETLKARKGNKAN